MKENTSPTNGDIKCIIEYINTIDEVVFESALDVFDANIRYLNKKDLITDVNENRMISESFYNEWMSNSNIIMESSADTGETTSIQINKEELERYRYDFKCHKLSIAKRNRRIAEYMISAYEASQQAKKNRTVYSR